MAIDAVNTNRLARFMNHAPEHLANCVASREHDSAGKVIIVLCAKRDIAPGEELCYNYGDSRPGIVERYPWLAPSTKKVILLYLKSASSQYIVIKIPGD